MGYTTDNRISTNAAVGNNANRPHKDIIFGDGIARAADSEKDLGMIMNNFFFQYTGNLSPENNLE